MSLLNTDVKKLLEWVETGEPIRDCDSKFATLTRLSGNDQRYAQPWEQTQIDAITALAEMETRPVSPDYYMTDDSDMFDLVTAGYFYDSALVHMKRAGLKKGESAFDARYNAIVCFMCCLCKRYAV